MATYTVVRGDTLDAIAHRYGTTYQELAVRNRIPNPDVIKVGQVIEVPPYAAETPQVQSMYVDAGIPWGKVAIGSALIGLLVLGLRRATPKGRSFKWKTGGKTYSVV